MLSDEQENIEEDPYMVTLLFCLLHFSWANRTFEWADTTWWRILMNVSAVEAETEKAASGEQSSGHTASDDYVILHPFLSSLTVSERTPLMLSSFYGVISRKWKPCIYLFTSSHYWRQLQWVSVSCEENQHFYTHKSDHSTLKTRKTDVCWSQTPTVWSPHAKLKLRLPITVLWSLLL